MARILILRDLRSGLRTARIVSAGGDTPILLPTQAIQPLNPNFPGDEFGGFVVTSVNAVSYLVAAEADRSVPVLAVGKASARALGAAKFRVEVPGDGTGAGMAEACARLFERTGLPLLYLAGHVRTSGLETELSARSIPFETIEVYDTVSIEPTAEAIEAAFEGGPPDAVLLLSLNQAFAFEDLASRYRNLLEHAVPLVLSPRIARGLRILDPARAIVAKRPELSGLLESYRTARRREPG